MDLPVDVEQVRAVLRAGGARFALVFGSHARGTAGPGSDVDVAALAPHPLDDWSLLGALPDLVDLVDLASAPEGLTGRIAVEGVVLLDDDPVARIRWQAATRKRHLDESGRRQRARLDFVAAHGRR